MERYLENSGAEKISHDKYGTLYRKTYPDDEPLVMLRVKNSTPEPDGSYRWYLLRVPSTMLTPKQAVAWTFGQDAEEYEPEVET